jgi:hypothetical protein
MSSDNSKSENKDFVTKYVEILARITDAPNEYQEAGMLFLLSTAVGRNWTFKSIPDAGIFNEQKGSKGKLLNLWFIILGKSRISRKSSGVLKHIQDLLNAISLSDTELTKSFTPEFLIKEMATKTKDKAGVEVTECYWIKDEVAGFFKRLKKPNSYIMDLDDQLSSIYDGTTVSRGTIGREKEIVVNPYLTCFLASTDFLPTLFDELQVRLGFLNRFIYVFGTKRSRKELRTNDLNDVEKRRINEIKAFLYALSNVDEAISMEMTEDAKEVYNSFEGSIDSKIEKEKLDLKEGYCGQLPNLVARLSCLFRISRLEIADIGKLKTTVKVEKQDVKRAMQYSNKAWSWFEQTLEMMQSSSDKKLPAIEQAKQTILELLEDRKEHHYREIIRYVDECVGVKSANTYKAINSLVDEGKIVKTKPGYYRLKLPKTKATEET